MEYTTANRFENFEFLGEMFDARLDVEDDLAGLLQLSFCIVLASLFILHVLLVLSQQMLTTATPQSQLLPVRSKQLTTLLQFAHLSYTISSAGFLQQLRIDCY